MGSLNAFIVLASGIVIAHGQPAKVFLSDPDIACRLMEPEGFHPGKWDLVGPQFGCFSTLGTRVNARNRSFMPFVEQVPEGNIGYIVEGNTEFRVSRIKLVLRVKPALDNEKIKSVFDDLAKTLLRRLGIEVPEELQAAVMQTHQFRQQNRRASLTFDTGRYPYATQQLIARDPRIRVVTLPRDGTPSKCR